jgi:hypothetical protein
VIGLARDVLRLRRLPLPQFAQRIAQPENGAAQLILPTLPVQHQVAQLPRGLFDALIQALCFRLALVNLSTQCGMLGER